MELVDANTKNFLYLTLSQYNKEPNPVRMRVSMRRDQPFWAGGNSYIACESFRVSAAPNPGGLYYKRIPYEWYIGATIKDAVKLNANEKGEFIPGNFVTDNIPATVGWVPGIGGDHDARFSEKHLRALNIEAVNIADEKAPEEYSSMKMQLGVGGRTFDDNASDDSLCNFLSNDPDIVQEYVGRFLNHYRLSKGSWLRLETEVFGKDGTSVGWAIGKVTDCPSLAMSGTGFGADGLSYQSVKITNVSVCQAAIGGHVHVPTETHTYRPPFQMDINLLADELQTKIDVTQVSEFWNNIGNNLTIQSKAASMWPGPGNTPAATMELREKWAPLLQEAPLVSIVCPVGCTMRGQANMFVGGAANDTIVNQENAIPKFPISFQGQMVEGTEFTMFVPADRAQTNGMGGLTPGTYHGIIKAVPSEVSSQLTFASMMVYMNDDAYNRIHLAKIQGNVVSFDNKRDKILNSDLVVVTNNQPTSLRIGGSVEMKVVAQHNLGSPPFWNLDSLTQSTHKVKVVLGSGQTDNVILRRPSREEERFIYTPNEFFYAFNKALYQDHSREVVLPFCLQTDENGGFVLRWRDVDPANPSSELIISVALVEALGLNNWFEFEADTLEGKSVKDMYYVKRHQVDDWSQSANNMFRWIVRTDLSNHIPSKSFHPPQNPPDIGSVLYDRAGLEWVFVDHKLVNQTQYTAVTKRIFPDVETDLDGNQYYVFRELPESGRITNTQQVSVESFATFSEITIVIPNLPFQPMLGTNTDERILASLRMPFTYTTTNDFSGEVTSTGFSYYGDLIFNTEPSRSYLKITTDQQLYDCDCEVRLIERDGTMHVMELPQAGEFQIKLRLLQTQ